MKRVRDRKELYSLLTSIGNSDVSLYSKYGPWTNPQIKVFWLEVDEKALSRVVDISGMEPIDRNLYGFKYRNDQFWIDTRNSRIWEIFTLSTTEATNAMIKRNFTNNLGVDRTWFTQRFMTGIEKRTGFVNRGFGIKYRDIFSPRNDRTDFSAKFWIGKNNVQDDLLERIKERFSISSTRFGKSEHGRPGQLYELFYNGHMTISASDDMEETFFLISTIGDHYSSSLRDLEKRNMERPTFVEVTFSSKIDREGFDSISQTGRGEMKLWLQQYGMENDLSRYSGVDLHTGDFVQIDMADKFSYISTEQKGCMNIAPRFGTLSSRYLSTMSTLYHDGVEIFA